MAKNTKELNLLLEKVAKAQKEYAGFSQER